MFNLDLLLEPLPGPDPCGPNLEYHRDFLALEQAARAQVGQIAGHVVRPAVAPDWAAVERLGLRLLTRTRDLRIAWHVARAGLHLRGLPGLAWGVDLLVAMLDRFGSDVHPFAEAGVYDQARPIERSAWNRDQAESAAAFAANIYLGLAEEGRRVSKLSGIVDDCVRAAGRLDFELSDERDLHEALAFVRKAFEPLLNADERDASQAAESSETTGPALVSAPLDLEDVLAHVSWAQFSLPSIEELADPVSADAPSGRNMEYDPEFLEFERALTGTPERQIGKVIQPAQPPQWAKARELAVSLLSRSKDLRVAVGLSTLR